MVRDNRHSSAYRFGAICPARGVGAAVITPVANTAAMNAHLAEISTQVAPGAHPVLRLDRAGWHQRGKRPPVPANLSLLARVSPRACMRPFTSSAEYRHSSLA